jgi:hypothetical protein
MIKSSQTRETVNAHASGQKCPIKQERCGERKPGFPRERRPRKVACRIMPARGHSGKAPLMVAGGRDVSGREVSGQ